MNSPRFAVLTRTLRNLQSRRSLTRLLGGIAAGAPLALPGRFDAVAKGKKGKKHKRKRRGEVGTTPPVIPLPPTPPCLAPGAPCTIDAQCCAQVCLDNGFCGCFGLGGVEVVCPDGCRCDQVNPGAVGACVEDIDVTPCCDSLPRCNSNADCGRTSFCDESVCGGGVCVRRCPT